MKVSTQKNIGRNLRTLRVYHNLSQSDIAQAAGLTRSTYVHYELGNRTPDAEALHDIAACFGLDMKVFFESDREIFISRITSARYYRQGEHELLDNYGKLTPFYQGILLEKSNQLVQWDEARKQRLKALQDTLKSD